MFVCVTCRLTSAIAFIDSENFKFSLSINISRLSDDDDPSLFLELPSENFDREEIGHGFTVGEVFPKFLNWDCKVRVGST